MNPYNHDLLNREIVTTRVFNAPRELVFRAWTELEHLAHWWGPKGFSNTFHEFDLRPGGSWRFTMHAPNGVDYANQVIFDEIAAPERLTFDHVSSPRFRVTVLLEDLPGGRTKVTFRQLFESAEDCRKIRVAPSGDERRPGLYPRHRQEWAQVDGVRTRGHPTGRRRACGSRVAAAVRTRP